MPHHIHTILFFLNHPSFRHNKFIFFYLSFFSLPSPYFFISKKTARISEHIANSVTGFNNQQQPHYAANNAATSPPPAGGAMNPPAAALRRPLHLPRCQEQGLGLWALVCPQRPVRCRVQEERNQHQRLQLLDLQQLRVAARAQELLRRHPQQEEEWA